MHTEAMQVIQMSKVSWVETGVLDSEWIRAYMIALCHLQSFIAMKEFVRILPGCLNFPWQCRNLDFYVKYIKSELIVMALKI